MTATSATVKPGPKERRFLDAMRDIFIGVKVDGQSGFINLMRIKAAYFQKVVEPALMQDIANALKDFPEFREELFDKLYSFFSRYFSRSGSICFAYTPQHMSVYEKVYTDEQDVVLFWKTHMLYYVKTDRLFRDLKVDVDGHTFFFDCAGLEHKKANEKRELVFTLDKVEPNGAIRLLVTYSERGRITKIDDILKALKKADQPLKEPILDKALKVFARQSEVDYFINKDAGAFLRQQFDLWMYQYVFKDTTTWSAPRIHQLQVLKEIAFKLVDFIGQFENELVRIWNKPKFVRGSFYVITLERLAAKPAGLKLIADILKHQGIKDQVKEWRDLGIVKADFDPKDIMAGRGKERKVASAWTCLPLDTRHFRSLELRLLGLFDNLDEELDGRLINSENYQALMTISRKFCERAQAIYIDPPYNTKGSEIDYINQYKHSSWLTLIENRLRLARDLLAGWGVACVAIDDSEYHRLRELMAEIFGGGEAMLGTVAVRSNPSGRSTVKGFSIAHDYAVFAGSSEAAAIGRLARTEKQIARYKESDAESAFEWVNFRKHGGAAANRKARRRLYYPIYVSPEREIRVPKMEWIQSIEEWKILEEPTPAEVVVFPINEDGHEKRWKWGHKSLIKQLSDFEARPDRTGNMGIYMKSRMNREGMLPLTWWDKKEYSATDYGTNLLTEILGESNLFTSPKSVHLVEDCLKVSGLLDGGLCVDFFGGSGTTAHAVLNLNRNDAIRRRYLLVEMAAYFDSVIVPRVKKVMFCEKWKSGKAAGGKGCSHFLKCYRLEQYPETLASACYAEDEDLFRNTKTDPYSQYVFFRDLKMAKAIELDYKKDEVNIHLDRLYPDIDLAETLSCVTGKWIKRITEDEVEFADGSKQSLKRPDWRLIKPLIFWGPIV
ncbi:MAG TPA: DNA methyltransferase [Candidatus Acidoferrum sp.]|nr:DNA methyltransferase [Candidatus Acidoferrum sp.]